MARILVVDDEPSMREFLEILLMGSGYTVDTAGGGIEAVAKISGNDDYDLVITDLQMPRGNGLQVLEHVKKNYAHTEVVMMTAFSTTETAVEAMRLGAYDYLTKPFKVDEIEVIVEKCLEKRRLALENRQLKSQLKERFSFSNIIGKSRAIRQVFQIVERVARARTSVLIYGETGTGKELVARAIHYNSPRSDKPFIVINCGAIPEQLMESELFGHKRGSFTGAVSDRKGLFQEADGGTLFLDEIGELSSAMQVKLLRVLQERLVKPIGGAHELPVDVRIVCATNRDLEVEVAEERFRQDLFYRLNVIQLNMPTLRERKEDVPLLARHFLEKFAKDLGVLLRGVEPAAMEMLLRYPYPGNVRELENIIERAATFETSQVLTVSSLPPQVVKRAQRAVVPSGDVRIPDDGVNLDDILAALEQAYLRLALERVGGNRTNAAKLLGMTFRSIRYKLDKYGID